MRALLMAGVMMVAMSAVMAEESDAMRMRFMNEVAHNKPIISGYINWCYLVRGMGEQALCEGQSHIVMHCIDDLDTVQTCLALAERDRKSYFMQKCVAVNGDNPNPEALCERRDARNRFNVQRLLVDGIPIPIE